MLFSNHSLFFLCLTFFLHIYRTVLIGNAFIWKKEKVLALICAIKVSKFEIRKCGDMNKSVIVTAAGLDQNCNGGVFSCGKEYKTEKKVEVEMVYWRLKANSGGSDPSQRQLAKEAKVGKTFAAKVLKEIKETGGIISVEDLKEERWERKQKGVGCICISLMEQQFLLDLRREDPTRTNTSYISSLHQLTGNIVSSSFISSFFKKVGPYKGNFR